MNRRVFVLGSLGLLAAPLAAEAQAVPRVYRIALIVSLAPVGEMTESANPALRAFFGELRSLGYVDGQNLVVAAVRPRASGTLSRDRGGGGAPQS